MEYIIYTIRTCFNTTEQIRTAHLSIKEKETKKRAEDHIVPIHFGGVTAPPRHLNTLDCWARLHPTNTGFQLNQATDFWKFTTSPLATSPSKLSPLLHSDESQVFGVVVCAKKLRFLRKKMITLSKCRNKDTRIQYFWECENFPLIKRAFSIFLI